MDPIFRCFVSRWLVETTTFGIGLVLREGVRPRLWDRLRCDPYGQFCTINLHPLKCSFCLWQARIVIRSFTFSLSSSLLSLSGKMKNCGKNNCLNITRKTSFDQFVVRWWIRGAAAAEVCEGKLFCHLDPAQDRRVSGFHGNTASFI